MAPGLHAVAVPVPMPSARGHRFGLRAFERLVIALAFVGGTTAFATIAATLAVAIAVDNVPVLPVAIVVVVAGGVFGSIAAAAASQRWWGFVLGLVLGFVIGTTAAATGRWTLGRVADGALTWGVRGFDRDGWASATLRDDGFHPRGKMVAALIVSRRLEGSHRDDVRVLLGAPDCAVDVPGDAWAIGSWTGFQIAIDCLVVAYDDEGFVASVRATHPRAGRLPDPQLSTIDQLAAYRDELVTLAREVARASSPDER